MGPPGPPALTPRSRVPRKSRPSAPSPGRAGSAPGTSRPQEPGPGFRRPRSPRASQGSAATAARHKGHGPLPSRAALRVPPCRRPCSASAEARGSMLGYFSRSSGRSERREPSSGGSPKHRLGGCRTSLPARRRNGLPPPCPGSSRSPGIAPDPQGSTYRWDPTEPGRAAPRANRRPIQTPTSAPCRKRGPARPAQRPRGPGTAGEIPVRIYLREQ